MQKELEEFGIKVNSYCPGWVDSGMNLDELPDYGDKARPKTPREGAENALWLATLDSDGPTASFFADNERSCLAKLGQWYIDIPPSILPPFGALLCEIS